MQNDKSARVMFLHEVLHFTGTDASSQKGPRDVHAKVISFEQAQTLQARGHRACADQTGSGGR